MDKSCKLMDEWSKRYYKTLYIFARRICRRPSDVENVVYQTLILAYKNRRKLKRKLKSEQEWKSWMLQAVRYCLLKEIYEEWERGGDIYSKYILPDSIDPEQMKEMIDHCQKRY